MHQLLCDWHPKSPYPPRLECMCGWDFGYVETLLDWEQFGKLWLKHYRTGL